MVRLNTVKMTYAIDAAGNVISVENVQNGIECHCRCIECNGQLSAKQGAINQWHFSHYNENAEINCQWSGESEIHLKVKDYLEQHKVLTVPIGFSNPTSFVIRFDEIQLEKSLRPTKRIPDVTGYCNGEKILIEVNVTHAVDKQKKSDYKKANVSVIELDFSDFKPMNDCVTLKEVEEHLLKGICTWLSVAPVGDIAIRFQEHERGVTIDLIKENNLLLVNYQNLNKQANYMADYINSYRARFERCQAAIKEASDRLSVLRKEIYQTRTERNSNIDAAESSFVNTLNQLEQNHLMHLDNRNLEVLERLKEEFIAELHNTHHERVDAINILEAHIKAKQYEHTKIQLEIEQYNINARVLFEAEELLKIKKANFQQIEKDWVKAAKANAAIKRNFTRLEPELRNICRKGGIPWPFDNTLIAELYSE